MQVCFIDWLQKKRDISVFYVLLRCMKHEAASTSRQASIKMQAPKCGRYKQNVIGQK